MDARLALLDARVAEAAEAWLTDACDVGVYARLVSAVQARRRFLDRIGPASPGAHPVLGAAGAGHGEPVGPEVDEPATPGVTDGDELERVSAAVRPVGSDLLGDPAAVLRRLRGG